MTFGVMAYLAVIGVCVALAAWVLEAGLRLANLPARWTWIGAMTLLFGLMPIAPSAEGELTKVEAKASGVSYSALSPGREPSGGRDVLGMLRSTIALAPQRAAAAFDQRLPRSVAMAAMVVWVAISGLLLLILACVHLRCRRRMTGWPAVRLHERTVRVSADVGPAVIGLRHPAIVIPRSLLDVSVTELQVVLAHEEEHLSARDNWLLTGGCIAAALIPWHPASWWMLARMRLAVELDCDRRVLRRGIERRLYGETLIDLGAHCGRLPLGVAALADHSTHLERRLLAMTAASRSFARSRATMLVAASALIIAAACEARLPTSPEIERIDVAAAEANPLAKAALSSGVTPIYEVDGARVSAAVARALSPDRIASVEVVKESNDGEAATIRIVIVTRDRPSAEVTTSGNADDAGKDATLHLGPTRIESQRLWSSTPLRIDRIDRFEGMVLVDDIRSSAAALSRIDPANIASIEVLKGSAATTRYPEPEAANGVIHVRMKPVTAVP